ncbi:hypothetical protein B0H16DRAFT_1886542 [Mycena metata]|uniref:Short-chain dehydrogenase/reductase family protein n=1 Tax=Mycena metata TaxID=1033252 RepID=A0AAD7NCV1_9AGAR|nr:hypothetical protein B0H16DRAFT_1886542 [Mycena metata]
MPILQPSVPELPTSLSFAGKTAIVTGANSGLGWASIIHLAQRHISTLILAVRTRKTGEATKAALLADPAVRDLPTQPIILIYELDLSRPSSVASFASKILADIPTLNILLLNAGIGNLAWVTTPETQTEQMFQINFLSNALLAVRLLPLLRASAQKSSTTSYLCIVGSRMIPLHSYTKNPIPETSSVFAFVNDPAHFKRFSRYPDTKVLVTMIIRELAKRTDAAEVTVNSVCPGMVKTNIDTKQPLWVKVPASLIQAIRGRTAEVGARSLVNAVSAGPETHGQMLGDFEVWENTFLDTDQGKKMEEKVWKETLAAADTFAPGSVEEANLRD